MAEPKHPVYPVGAPQEYPGCTEGGTGVSGEGSRIHNSHEFFTQNSKGSNLSYAQLLTTG